MQDLVLALKSANSERSEKRSEMLKVNYYEKLFKFIESRFADGESYTIKNYFETYKMVTKDANGENKTIYGFIADNNRTYLGLNDLAFAKKLYKREIKKVDGEETTAYTQLLNKVEQGDLAVLFSMFKSKYKDALLAFDLLYCALLKHNESKFVSESYVYPSECFQRFKGEYVTSNFYLFNLKIGGTSTEKLNEIFADICKDYEASQAEAPQPQAEAQATA
jgi:hypothetical protein